MNEAPAVREGDAVQSGTVLPEWIDINEHMNVAYYVLAFDRAVDALWARFGITDQYIRERQASTFAVEAHVSYRRELRLGESYVVTSQILAYDEKRIHQLQRMYHAEKGFVAATCEWLNLHVDLVQRRVTPWPEDILQAIAAQAASQPDQQQPDEAGGRILVQTPRWSVGDYGQ